MIKSVFFCVMSGITIPPVKIHPERITWEDKKLANDLDCHRVEFPV